MHFTFDRLQGEGTLTAVSAIAGDGHRDDCPADYVAPTPNPGSAHG